LLLSLNECIQGVSLSAFYGNFFVRSTDLLALANVNPDSAIAVQVNMEEKLSTTVCFQAALLYTSSKEVYSGFDLKATVSLISKIAVDRSMSGSALSDSREAIVNAVVDALGAYQKTMRQGRAGGLTAFCAGRSVKLDDRVAAMMVLRFCPLEQILSEFYPQLYRVNEILQLEEGKWPQPLPLSFEYIARDGIYLIEAGSAIYVYISATSNPQLLHDLFGCSYSLIDEVVFRDAVKQLFIIEPSSFKHSFRIHDNPFSEKVHGFVRHVTALKFYLGPVIIVK
uniref:Sec23/sec24 transport family protein n=1 Tax=Heligmosomoides polygyrus TaxID=6339 RepID=A0A183GX78_HELPZ